ADTPIPKAVAKTVLHALRSHTGDILAFLPGAGEIGRCKTLLENELHDVIICPLYGDLPQREQQQALMPDPGGHRKVVLATSIAETSLTIEGIRVVIDSGYARNPAFDPKSGLSKLETMRVTADAADQRAGRAARLGPGTAYRLWSEGVQYQLIPQRRPEILEADLAPLTLELAAWGVTDPASLSWLTVPPTGTLAQARQLLENLDAMEGGKITDRGRAMLKLPTHPRLAHLMLEAERMNLLPLAADIASLLEERDPLASVSDFPGHLNAGADLSRRAELLRNRRAGERVNGERTVWDRVERSAENWCRIFRIQPDRSSVRSEQVGKLVAAAYPERIARRREEAQNTWRMANGRNARLPDSDPLAAEEWLAIAHTDAGDRDGRIFLAAPLDIRDILPLAREQTVLAWDYRNGTLLSRREKRIGEIVAETKPVHETDPEKVRELLCEVIKKEGLLLFNRTPELLQLQARTQYLRHLRPELALPDLSNEALLENPEKWLSPFLNNIRKKDDFQKTDLGAALNALLGWENTQTLDRLVPDKIKVPSGFHVNLQYFPDDRPPVLAVRIQEVFGLMDTPMVNDGRTGVLLHLLSPGYKPVQVTQDLRSFWQNTYNIIRKELKIRYPRHFWPEDPWTAEAVRGVKRNEAGQAIRK
ncbi:MAG: ATP-dependent helicase HrpB, partial [Bacteroidota bacterium]